MNSRVLHNEITLILRDASYDEREAASISYIILEHYYGLTRAEILTSKAISSSDLHLETLQRVIEGLPIQYALGETLFYGLPFKVDSSVLVPRPETEELVDIIINENKLPRPSIVDIGTGSGCIAVSLARYLKNSKVYGYDISSKALSVAAQNSRLNDVEIIFGKIDVLTAEIALRNIDIVVSNPPYVRSSEKQFMEKRVLDHEPEIALFVDDENPVIFYERITQLAGRCLSSNGKLYFEINEAFPNEVKRCLEKEGFKDISVVKDLNNKPRIVKGSLR